MKQTQRQAIFELLITHYNERVGLPTIIHATKGYIAQYNARILEIRRSLPKEMCIKNKKRLVNGQWYSWFKMCDSEKLSENNKNN